MCGRRWRAADGAVQQLETPGGVAAMTTDVGDYSRLGDANAAIDCLLQPPEGEARR